MNGEIEITETAAGRGSSFLLQFARDVAEGLSATPKSLPCKYIYDERGSGLFKQIMELEEYYLTRCELEIMESFQADIAVLVGEGDLNLVELGAGNGLKTRILLHHFLEKGLQFRYVPIDISRSVLCELTRELTTSFSGLTVQGLATDYFTGLQRLSQMNHRRNVVLFLGSNIGNFNPSEAGTFLSHLWDSMNDGDFALIGFDLKKDIETQIKAYNDSQGITAQFNMNILHRINNELRGDFDPGQFEYYSTYNPLSGAIESFLISRKKQEAVIEACRQVFSFNQWEPIHTESSYKYQEDDIANLAREKGFEFIAGFYDRRRFFTDSLWQVRKSG